jgi:hypothetical protein
MVGGPGVCSLLAPTELLRLQYLRVWAVLLLLGASFLGILASWNIPWSRAFPAHRGEYQQLQVRKRRSGLALLRVRRTSCTTLLCY